MADSRGGVDVLMQKFQQQQKEAEKERRRGGSERGELREEREKEVPSMNEWTELTGDVLFCLPACLSAEEEEVQQIMVLLNQL